MSGEEQTYLLADIGGTHTRLTLDDGGGDCGQAQSFDNKDFDGLGDLVETYLRGVSPKRPTVGAFAVACPVTGDRIRLTNLAWEFSVSELQKRLKLEALEVVNDFAAQALAIPELAAEDFVQIGGGEPLENAPVGVLGPGTGLGVAGLVRCDRRWMALPGEGGHASLAASTDEEADLIAELRRRYGHVSAERVLSGGGLVELYRWCKGRPELSVRPPDVTDRALDGDDPEAEKALALFFAMLGTVAGDLALTLGAAGGVYLTGGILPSVCAAFETSSFRERFVAKGRFRSYLEGVPTRLIVSPFPAFKGLAAVARQRRSSA